MEEASHCSSADDDCIPILQAILLLIRRYHLADSPLATTTASTSASQDDADSESPPTRPLSVSWLSLLHSVLSQRSSPVTTATSLYLRARQQTMHVAASRNRMDRRGPRKYGGSHDSDDTSPRLQSQPLTD